MAKDGQTSTKIIAGLEKLYRENVKLSEEYTQIVNGKSHEMNLLDSIKVLAALRESSESATAQSSNSQPVQRNASGKLGRVNKKGNSSKASSTAATQASREDPDDIPAAPSPKIHLNPSSRSTRDKPSRAGSVSHTRETSVKLEDGAESVASSADGVTASSATGSAAAAGGSRPSNRIKLTKGEIVFCRHSTHSNTSADAPEGEGILCRVTSVIGDGKQRRYEVQDADTSIEPRPPPQRASIQQLIQIPEQNTGLPELAKGRNVLAQYPDTTTFYKAEVVEAWKSGAGDVRLKFEDDEMAREVERRFVLTEK